MKTLLTVGLLLAGLSGQALGMGHPHNVFAARKQLRARSATALTKSRTTACSPWQPVARIDNAAFSRRLLAALSQLRPAY